MYRISPTEHSSNKLQNNVSSPISTKYGSLTRKGQLQKPGEIADRKVVVQTKGDDKIPAAMRTAGHSFFASSFYSRKTNRDIASSSISPKMRAKNPNKDLEREFSKSTLQKNQHARLSEGLKRLINKGMQPAGKQDGCGEGEGRQKYHVKPVVDKIKRRRLRDCLGEDPGGMPEDVSHTYVRSHSQPEEVSDYSSVHYSESEKQESDDNYQEPETAALLLSPDKIDYPPFHLESGQRTVEEYPPLQPASPCHKALAHTPKIINPQRILTGNISKDNNSRNEIAKLSKIISTPA